MSTRSTTPLVLAAFLALTATAPLAGAPSVATAVAAASAWAPAAAQDPALPPPPSARAGDDAQQEMKAIFARVERTLRAIDVYLSDAAAGEVPLDVPQDSGIDDLLRSTQAQSKNIVRDMERLLELAVQQSQQSGQSGSSGSQPPPQPGQGQLDKDRGNATQEPEQTPEKPGEEPGGQEEKPAGQEPDGGDASDETPTNHPNEPPPGNRGGLPQSRGDEGERWGELPPHAREVFRSQGGGDLPAQYRDWIDSYYRRLNRRP